MADNIDDEFDDLFSFGAEAPSNTTAPAPSPPPSDFDLLSDLSANAAPAPAPANDDFDDIFGTPPGTPATPKTPLDVTGNSMPSPQLQEQAMSIDDFHVHDAGTRDFLEWLDDDAKPEGKAGGGDDLLDVSGEVDAVRKDESNGQKNVDVEEDDFDFDQMLADADVPSSSMGGSQRITLGSDVGGAMQPKVQVQQFQSSSHDVSNEKSMNITTTEPSVELNAAAAKANPAVMERFTTAEPTNSQSFSGTTTPEPITPEPISKPYVSACIEEELSFDQWDETEESDDFQITATDGSSADNDPALSDMTQADSSKLCSVASPPKASFMTLADAIRSNSTTIDDVRTLFTRENGRSNLTQDVGVSLEDRPYLWTKVICGKVLGELDNGSLADSFREWQKKNRKSEKYSSEECSAMMDEMLVQAGSSTQGSDEDLLSVLMFQDNDLSAMKTPDAPRSIDPLIPPVTYAILQSGIPPAAASVVLSQIEPTAMPLLRLSQSERYSAVKALHSDFYLLACYHLPLLIMHLDRHCPGWYWPKPLADRISKGKEEQKEEKTESGDAVDPDAPLKDELFTQDKNKHAPASGGLVPMSWFVTNFAGELGKSCLDHQVLLPLWDHLLTMGDCSKKFFLAIAILEKHSDSLLMSRGEELSIELEKVLNFKANSFDEESFVGADSSEAPSKTDNMISEWLNLAQSLFECTPSSVVNMLRTADERAFTDALNVRTNAMDEKAKAQLEANEAALKKERDEREAEAKKALMKARLVTYYRNKNPEKVDTIDQIYNMFEGRFDVLNEKLKKKYGEGFLPDEPLKEQTRSFFVSVNQSITETRKHVAMTVAERRKRSAKPSLNSTSQMRSKVALEVSPTEIIPYICSSKGHNPVTGEKWSSADIPLKFYLIDCRPEGIAKEQGRFPTSVNMGPQKLQDPDELQQLLDMFESLRGAVHICVMGEGFCSFPALYEHPLTENEKKLLEDDISRTSSCCLFFLKKGFPFVSTLKGGFAAAHAFLWRNGPDLGIPPSNVLVDYDPVVSLFAQLEISHQEQTDYMNAPAREKTALALQKIIDKSMMRLTFEEQRLNGLASDFTRPENVDKMKQSMRNLGQKVSTAGAGISFGKTPPLFMSKTFAASKADESADKVATKEEAPKAASITSFAEKMKFKRWHQETTEPSKGETVEEAAASTQSESEVMGSTVANTTPKGDEAFVDDAENPSTTTTESKDDATTDSLQSIYSVAQQDPAPQEQVLTEPASGKTFSTMSQFRLKIGFSMGKAADDKGSESKVPVDEGGSQEKSSQEKSQIKTAFSSFLKRPVAPPAKPDVVNETDEKTEIAVTSDAKTEEVTDISAVKTKLTSFTKSFGASSQTVRQNPFAKLLHQKTEAPEQKGISEQKDTDSSSITIEHDSVPPPPPTSPVKTKFDSFVFSANKLLNDISEHDDPFNPKNDRPTKTRFSGQRKSSSESITAAKPEPRIDSESLLFMEDHDDGQEDEIDFSGATELETPDTISDPFEAAAQTSLNPTEDLFRGLHPQPKEDPTQNLFDDFFDDKKEIDYEEMQTK